MKRFALCFGLLGAADTIIVLAISGGVNLGTLLPGVCGAVLSVWALIRPRKGPSFAFLRRFGIKTVAFAAVCLWALSFVAVQTLILSQAFGDACPNADWCILLGAGVRGDKPTLTLARRIDAATTYLKSNPQARVVVSGAQGPGEMASEAEVMRRCLVKAGIASTRIFIEDKATSTIENLRYSRDVMAAAGGESTKPVAIISSDFHLLRVRLLAVRLGMKTCRVPASTPWYLLPNVCIREYFALAKSVVLDR